MESATPKISVIVPVYNVERYLPRCIDSILVQTFTDFELLLVDDGSTDASGVICDEYAKRDNRIRVFHKENGGVSSARNVGLDNARGEWITFCDSDDYFISDKALMLLFEHSRKYGNVSIVLANSIVIREGEKCSLLKLNDDMVSDRLFFSVTHLALWGYLFNSRIINKNKLKFIDGLAFSEDAVFIYQYFRYCKSMAYCGTPIYFYRPNENSACRSKDGLRKACNQFEAARHINDLANEYRYANDEICAFLKKESHRIANMGLFQFAESGSICEIPLCLKKYHDSLQATLCQLSKIYCKLTRLILVMKLKKMKSYVN